MDETLSLYRVFESSPDRIIDIQTIRTSLTEGFMSEARFLMIDEDALNLDMAQRYAGELLAAHDMLHIYLSNNGLTVLSHDFGRQIASSFRCFCSLPEHIGILPVKIDPLTPNSSTNPFEIEKKYVAGNLVYDLYYRTLESNIDKKRFPPSDNPNMAVERYADNHLGVRH